MRDQFLHGAITVTCTGHGKAMEFLELKIFWNFWKSYGISPKIDEGHGKVMEF